MTEIPEHLLKRSKAAKGDKSGGGDDAASDGGSTPVAAESAAAPVAAAPAANLPNLDPEPEPPKPVPHFVAASMARKRVPVWVLPVIAALPIWAYSFAGTMQQPEVEDELFIEAAELYAACAGCHGGNGGGGTGYQLSGGEVINTFPDPIDQMVHVARGSDPILDQEYGARTDEPRISGARGRGAMPAQLATLTQLELELVIFHERAVLSEEDTSSEEYQLWIEHMREGIEAGDEEPIDLELLLDCADPEVTPEARGVGSSDPDHPCPGWPDVIEEAAG